MKKSRVWLIVGLCLLLFFVVIPAILLITFKPFVNAGQSMLPTLKDGQYVIVQKISKNYSRGAIVVFRNNNGLYFVKRVVAIPGDKVRIMGGKVWVNGSLLKEDYTRGSYTAGEVETTLSAGNYYVLGDNRSPNASNDSRTFGSLNKNQITGSVVKILNSKED